MDTAVAITLINMIHANQQFVQRYNNSTTSVYRSRIESCDQSLVDWICKTHPETAHSIQSQKRELRAHYVNVISDIKWKLWHKRTLSDAELTRTSDKLTHLTQAGLKVEWLWSKLERKKREAYLERKKREAYLERKKREAYLERKKRDACEARIVELKQDVKKLELAKSGLKAELKIEKAKLNPRSFRNLLGNCFCLKT